MGDHPVPEIPWYFPHEEQAVPRFRDREAYVAIAAILEGLGEFDSVTRSDDPDRARVPADATVWAHVDEDEPRTQPDPDQPSRMIRTGVYSLTLGVRAAEPEEAKLALDRLDSVVRNALEGKDYGFCTAHESRLSDARYDESAAPTIALVYPRAQFEYVIRRPGLYDETP